MQSAQARERKESILSMLDRLRREAARGDLRTVIVMLERHDGTYSTEHAIAAPPLRLVTSAQ